MKLKFCQTARLEVCYFLELFFAEVKIFIFRPKTMDYSSWFDFWESKKSSQKKIPSQRVPQKKQNAVNFSFMAPSSEELRTLKTTAMTTFTMIVCGRQAITPQLKVLYTELKFAHSADLEMPFPMVRFSRNQFVPDRKPWTIVHSPCSLIENSTPSTNLDSNDGLFLEELQPLSVLLPLLVALPVGLQLSGGAALRAEEGQPVGEGSADQRPTPVRLERHDERLVGLHQRPAVEVGCHTRHHGLGGQGGVGG